MGKNEKYMNKNYPDALPTKVQGRVITEMREVAGSLPPGCFVEVGVYQGGTAWHLCEVAKTQNRQVFLYDTFEGIPFKDEIDHHNVGDFSDTDYELVKSQLPYATVIKGVFPDSAVLMPPIAFAHIDCDQYRAIKSSVEHILPMMVPGGVIWFDDVVDWIPGTMQAIKEMFGDQYITSSTKKVYVKIPL
jgi:O-methyltransferase